MPVSWIIAIMGLALLSLTPIRSQASEVVVVSLFDKGAAAGIPVGFSYGMPAMDMSRATMWMKLSADSIKAGLVTFEVTNNSKDMVHEMLVIPLKDSATQLPYDDKDNRVDEDKAGSLGEVSELDPGKSGSLTLTLKPAKYLLICNQPGHFGAGMWMEFNVTE